MSFTPDKSRGGIEISPLFDAVTNATEDVKKKLKILQGKGSNISIADMFEMQMLMNRLSQLSEMSTSVVSASNSAISSMARNVKS
jgi:hypothetical protein